MESKNPRRSRSVGLQNHRADDRANPRRKTLKLQFNCGVPAIHIRKDGPLYRVQIVPPQEIHGSIARPESYAGPIAARQAAGWLAQATGLKIIDLLAVAP
tara:strand:+ start:2334 stop:2633 length:300 start_codon:yes stop_codon:yes gene_type:complete